MYQLHKLKRLHLELSSRCNASCPACSRNISGGAVVENLKLTELTLEDIQNFFPDEITTNLKSINYCGNLGDSGTARDLLPILKHFQSKSADVVQQVRTNGGMRSPDFWNSVGEFFAQRNYPADDHLFSLPAVVFSVDGLEDTNHIYRRGVKWEKLYANMKAYSESGAKGIWEWLTFKHNQHQLDEARKLAKSLNFVFVEKNPLGFGEYQGVVQGINVYNKEGIYDYTIYPAGHPGEMIDASKVGNQIPLRQIASRVPKLTEFSKQLALTSGISCKSLTAHYQEVYVSSSGHLLPCCFLGGILGNSNASYSRYQFNEMLQGLGLDTLDLRKNNLVKILKNPNFSTFFLRGWAADSVENGKILFCTETCGEISAIDKLYTNKIIPISKNE